VIWTTASPAHGFRWGVFREHSFFSNYRRCRIQEIAASELILDEVLARATTLPEAMSTYRWLIAIGRCAP
jgi:hypothetical protein